MLARVHMAGGAPREILDHVLSADWSPDGKELAVVRYDGDRHERSRLEFPIGRLLRESAHELRWPRVSPQGDVVAIAEVDSETPGAETRSVSLVDRTGKRQVLTTGWRWLNGLAWSPRGDEVWFAATKERPHHSLWAVSRSGRVRLLVSFQGFAAVQDVSPDGRALVVFASYGGWGAAGLLPGDPKQRNLSWLDRSIVLAITPDGRMVMGTEHGAGLKDKRAVYLRPVDGSSPAVRLGDGFGLALSPDARWVLSRPQHNTKELVLLPTGPGEPRSLPNDGIEFPGGQGFLRSAWAADGKRILVAGRQDDRPWRSFVMDLEGRSTAVTPEGVIAAAISPDGERVAAIGPDRRIVLYPVAGGAPQAIPGPPEKGVIATWSSDGRSLFTRETLGVEMRIFRRDLDTGQRMLVKDFVVPDPAGILSAWPLVSADGRTFVYNWQRGLNSLYLVDGLE
jgi:dipeptidyl aminopeptidase/acylaminoacyl peptidase